MSSVVPQPALANWLPGLVPAELFGASGGWLKGSVVLFINATLPKHGPLFLKLKASCSAPALKANARTSIGVKLNER
ncbi:MAG: hypothetical protein BWK73_04295 [Thiothrix lacustris]|uniref:Uncharacterized protein n=1 Tax=Thiothrix lacustris TaxID=525917 RepID=A0A1Y1QXZ0_9GAMM|nr:MAG: hypothetical protein BWK73_04295 [Thiothrix lacustris]